MDSLAPIYWGRASGGQVAALRALFGKPASAGLPAQSRNHSGMRGFFQLESIGEDVDRG